MKWIKWKWKVVIGISSFFFFFSSSMYIGPRKVKMLLLLLLMMKECIRTYIIVLCVCPSIYWNVFSLSLPWCVCVCLLLLIMAFFSLFLFEEMDGWMNRIESSSSSSSLLDDDDKIKTFSFLFLFSFFPLIICCRSYSLVSILFLLLLFSGNIFFKVHFFFSQVQVCVGS